MQLNNEFTVPAGMEDTWRLLTDLDRVAPCMPGAAVTGRDGEEYQGTVAVKVGPIGANFRGTARFIEKDDASHSAVIAMAGKDSKGAASANATIRARLEDIGDGTRVMVDTDLDITGRMAQFGRGAIADVSNRLIGQFTENLSQELVGEQPALEGPPVESGAAGSSRQSAEAVSGREPAGASGGAPASLNVLELVGPGLLREVGRPALFFLLGYLVARAYPRRNGRP